MRPSAVTEGSVFLKGKDITGTSVRERIGLGIGYVPVDRYRDAMVGDMTLAENMMLKTSFDRTWTRHGFLNRKKLYDHTQKAIEDFEIKAPGPDAQIRGLSGGNQQKVILGRWLLTQPDFLILDEPTRGIDIGTKTEIQKLVLKLAEDGMSVVFISSEIEEMLRTCSRMAVLRDGEKVGELAEGELSQDSIMKAIAGGGEE